MYSRLFHEGVSYYSNIHLNVPYQYHSPQKDNMYCKILYLHIEDPRNLFCMLFILKEFKTRTVKVTWCIFKLNKKFWPCRLSYFFSRPGATGQLDLVFGFLRTCKLVGQLKGLKCIWFHQNLSVYIETQRNWCKILYTIYFKWFCRLWIIYSHCLLRDYVFQQEIHGPYGSPEQ